MRLFLLGPYIREKMGKIVPLQILIIVSLYDTMGI